MTDNKSQLRSESGSLQEPFVAEEYNQGIDDFRARRPAPTITTPSYEMGRQKAAELEANRSSNDQWVKNVVAERDADLRERMKEILSPEQFERYEIRTHELEDKETT